MFQSVTSQVTIHMPFRSVSFYLLVPFIVFAARPSAADDTRVKLTTGLGVESEVSVWRIDVDDKVLNHALCPFERYAATLPLQVANGVFISVPLDDVRSVSTKDGDHIVRMSDGHEWKGKLCGKLQTSGNAKQVFDLATAISLEVLSPATRPPAEKLDHAKTWELQIPAANSALYNVVAPKFAFQYYSGAGYVLGGSDHETADTAFYLKVGDQEQQGNIGDFKRLSLGKSSEPGGVQLTVETKTGVKTTGTPLLKAKDDKGYHQGAIGVLVARLASNHQIRVAVSVKEWSLTQKDLENAEKKPEGKPKKNP